jgi:hypothetical protein
VATDPLRKAHADGQRLRQAIDTEYRSARRDSTWGRTEPQMVERWRLAVRAWTQAVEATLRTEDARLGRFRTAPPTTEPAPAGESAAWVEIRNALAGKVAAVGKLIEERGAGGSGPGGTPPPSPFRKR